MIKLSQILNEMVLRPHLIDRVYDRLDSESKTNFHKVVSKETHKKVKAEIKSLEHINFDSQDNIGIMIYKGVGSEYFIYDGINEKGQREHSEGNHVWGVVRGNELETLYFMKNNERPQNTQIHFTIDQLFAYYAEKKGNKGLLTNKDAKAIQMYGKVPTSTAPAKPTVHIYVIGGVKYILSDDKAFLVKKNNPSEKIPVDDAMDMLKDVDLETLIDSI